MFILSHVVLTRKMRQYVDYNINSNICHANSRLCYSTDNCSTIAADKKESPISNIDRKQKLHQTNEELDVMSSTHNHLTAIPRITPTQYTRHELWYNSQTDQPSFCMTSSFNSIYTWSTALCSGLGRSSIPFWYAEYYHYGTSQRFLKQSA